MDGSEATTPSRSPTAPTSAARAQRDATVIGWIDGEPVVRDRLDGRLAALRTGAGAGALPALGSGEDRQLVRWTAQVLFTEEICRREAVRRRLQVPPPEPLHPVSAVRLGSINAAAWAACPEVAAVFEAVVPAGPTPAGVVGAGLVPAGDAPAEPPDGVA
ncbi:MAG: DUF7158 domain-containing protein, partial [Micromonosporaceae bacterium]